MQERKERLTAYGGQLPTLYKHHRQHLGIPITLLIVMRKTDALLPNHQTPALLIDLFLPVVYLLRLPPNVKSSRSGSASLPAWLTDTSGFLLLGAEKT